VTYFSNFGIPLISPEWLKIQISNFASRLTVRDTKPKKWKMGQKGAWPRSRDLLSKFWDPLISRERLKVQNSNLSGRLLVRDTNPKNEKWVKRGRGLSHVSDVTYFSNFGTPLIFLEWLKIQTSNFACRLMVRDTKT